MPTILTSGFAAQLHRIHSYKMHHIIDVKFVTEMHNDMQETQNPTFTKMITFNRISDSISSPPPLKITHLAVTVQLKSFYDAAHISIAAIEYRIQFQVHHRHFDATTPDQNGSP